MMQSMNIANNGPKLQKRWAHLQIVVSSIIIPHTRQGRDAAIISKRRNSGSSPMNVTYAMKEATWFAVMDALMRTIFIVLHHPWKSCQWGNGSVLNAKKKKTKTMIQSKILMGRGGNYMLHILTAMYHKGNVILLCPISFHILTIFLCQYSQDDPSKSKNASQRVSI